MSPGPRCYRPTTSPWPTATKPPPILATKAAEARKLTFKERRELEGMEAAILAAETRVQELETTLNDPDFHATRSREAYLLVAEVETTKAEVARLYDRWQELAARSEKPPGSS